MLDSAKLSEALTERYGLPIVGNALDDGDGQRATFRPRDIAYTQGFSIAVLIGWKTVDVEFVPGTFASQLLTLMAAADPGQRAVFGTFVQSAMKSGADVTFQVNGACADPLAHTVWPSQWRSLSLRFRRGPIEIDGKNPAVMESLALAWSGRMLGSVLALIPLEPIAAGEASPGEAEGGGHQVLVTRYERSVINRAACIDFHGALCKACGFNFESFYGPAGAGYIEVHHVETVASLAPGTILDPQTDLVPLCSNCHSMAHKRRPLPYTVAELQSMIAAARAASPDPSLDGFGRVTGKA